MTSDIEKLRQVRTEKANEVEILKMYAELKINKVAKDRIVMQKVTKYSKDTRNGGKYLYRFSHKEKIALDEGSEL
jgi:hypothetical protein